jgi:hypothetical protein
MGKSRPVSVKLGGEHVIRHTARYLVCITLYYWAAELMGFELLERVTRIIKVQNINNFFGKNAYSNY